MVLCRPSVGSLGLLLLVRGRASAAAVFVSWIFGPLAFMILARLPSYKSFGRDPSSFKGMTSSTALENCHVDGGCERWGYGVYSLGVFVLAGCLWGPAGRLTVLVACFFFVQVFSCTCKLGTGFLVPLVSRQGYNFYWMLVFGSWFYT